MQRTLRSDSSAPFDRNKALECDGRGERRRGDGAMAQKSKSRESTDTVREKSHSGVALRLPPQSIIKKCVESRPGIISIATPCSQRRPDQDHNP
jgi:hypothetical protein